VDLSHKNPKGEGETKEERKGKERDEGDGDSLILFNRAIT
jgi:hypothetical protein